MIYTVAHRRGDLWSKVLPQGSWTFFIPHDLMSILWPERDGPEHEGEESEKRFFLTFPEAICLCLKSLTAVRLL